MMQSPLIETTGSGGWSWFPWGVLRSAGFPIKDVLEALGNESLTLAASSWMSCESDVACAADAFVACLPAIVSRPQRRRIQRAINSRRRVDETASGVDLANRIQDWNARIERRSQAAEMFGRAYEWERVGSTDRLIHVLEDDRIRRALLWQNRRILPFLLKTRDNRGRRALLKYLTRYSTKNDTIGFFGPVTWIRLSSEPGFGELVWGCDLIRGTLLSFETWPIAVIAGHLAEHVRLRSWLSPRRTAQCRVQQHDVSMPPESPISLSARDTDILRLCDGRRSAWEIAKELGLADLTAFDTLREAGLITWTVECPMRTNPESTIGELAARIDDEETRAVVEAHSMWLASATGRLREHLDTSTSLAAVLEAVDTEFEHRYSRAAVQGLGEYYAGRTLTYIDCERDVSLTLKADLLAAVMRGLSPILLSLRWYSHTIVTQFLLKLADIVPPGQTTPLVTVFPVTMSLMWSTVQEVAAAFRAKWQQLLPVDVRQRIMQVDAAYLAARVAAEFAAPHPGWPMARVHNPDLLIAATNHADLGQGKCTIVLGDVHAGLPSMFQAAVFSLCPEPEHVRELYRTLATPPPIINEVSQRLNLGECFHSAAQLLLPDEPVTHLNARPIADFDVCHGDTGLRIVDVTTMQSWAAPVFFDALLSRSTFHADPFDQPDVCHVPRIMVGEVVVSREKWRVTPTTFGVVQRPRADPGEDAQVFLAVRRWAGENGVPRYVFAKSSREPKPIFLDLESQPCVELLSHLLKRASAGGSPEPLTISEMLPAPDRCWLRDGAGNRYTSELRLLAIDPVPYPSNQD
jgi:hypothetical protein